MNETQPLQKQDLVRLGSEIDKLCREMQNVTQLLVDIKTMLSWRFRDDPAELPKARP